MLATVFRGLRSRGLLSVGSVLLTALAIGSAVLGPIFQVAVTNSYLVSRLDEAPNRLTGLSWDFQPSGAGDPAQAQSDADAAVRAFDGPFASPQTVLESSTADVYGGRWRITAKADACAHLVVDGACPDKPGEALMLAGDLDFSGSKVGQTIDFGDVGKLSIVGTYRVPAPDQEDFWFDLERFISVPPLVRIKGPSIPYTPAPLVTVPAAFETLPEGFWRVRVDRRLSVPSDLTLPLIGRAEAVAATLDGPAARIRGGKLAGNSINDLASIVRDTRAQQATARASIAPAVLSLVLVALALLLRLLMAAADLRLPELALASLRGLGRRQMWSLGLSEPAVLVLLSVPVGAVFGIGLSLGLVRWWLVPGLPLPLPWQAVATGLGVALAALVVAVLAVGLVLRVSLSEQLTGVRRPKQSSRLTVVAQLVLVATALAVLASKLSTGEPGDPDATDLVLPVLLAVVAGLAATRFTGGLAAWWTRRRRGGRSLPGFVAARAISRRQEGTLVILPVTAAIAICVFGAGVYDSAAHWRGSVAATAAPGAVVWTSPLQLDQTVDLTHRLDPDGQYLMAAGTLVTQGPSFAVLDTPRLSRVGTWQDQWTPGMSTQQITAALAPPATFPVVTGTTVGLTVDNRSDAGEVYVRLRLDAEGKRIHDAYLGPFGPGAAAASARAPYCRAGCSVQAATVGRAAALPITINGDLTLSHLVADGQPVSGGFEGAGWGRAPQASAGEALGDVTTEGDSLGVHVASGDEPIIVQLTAGGIPEALPVLKGVDATTEARGGAASQTSATTFPVDPVASTQSVPFLGPIGLMIDYRMLTTDRQIYEQQDATIVVLARADTPPSMVEGLQSSGALVDTTLAEVRGTLDQGAYALALRLYAVVAALVLLMALAGLFVSTAVQLPARRRDAASLRVVGVPRRSVMSAVLRELLFVLGGTAVAGLAAGTLAQYVVLRTVTLGYVESIATPALIASIDPARLGLLSAVAALLFGAVAAGSAALTVRGARGATLRETAR